MAGRLLVAVLCLGLAALALYQASWLPPLLAVVGANSELIQGVQALAQLVLWIGAAAAVFAYLLGRSRPGESAQPKGEPDAGPQTVDTGGAAPTLGGK